MSLAYNDGRALAPGGAPQLPTLLQGYATRPPWSVAGVDYAVGVPSGTVLKNPATISMPGVTVDATHHIIYVTGSNVTLNGYDFSLNGGWGVWIKSGASNTTIENSNFKVGGNNNLPIRADSGAGSLTVQYNNIDGGGGQNGAIWALISYSGSGAFVSKYNIFQNAPEDAIDFNNGHLTATIEYNVFDNLGTTSGSHPDPVQWVGVTSVNSVEAFNTIYQPNPSGMQGIQLQAQSGETLTNTTIENNVVVAKAPGIDMSYSIAVIQNSGNTINGAVVADNYIDSSGAYGPFYPPSGSNLSFTNNINLVTGGQIASPGGTASSDVASVIASPASGTLVPGSTVTLTLNMDRAQTVSGSPTLTLNDGGKAIFSGGSGTSQLRFTYVVAPTDTAVATLAISAVNLPAGAAITDANGDPAVLSGAIRGLPGLSVNPVTSGPRAVPDSALTPENHAVAIPVLSNDSDTGGSLNPASVAVTAAPSHGSVAVNASTGVVTYTPASGFYGTDVFDYTVADSRGLVSAPGAVTVTVDAPPTATADAALTRENTPVAIAVLANDTDVDGSLNPASVAVTAAPSHGSVAINASTGAVTYTPASGFYGTDVFDYTVADTRGVASAPGAVTVTVDAPPTANADAASTPENTPVTIAVLANDTDVDGSLNPATVKVTTAALHGSTTVNPVTGVITYTPATGYVGADTFAYTVADTKGVASAPGTVSIGVSVSRPAPSQGGYADGTAGAPAGTPQLPNLLSSYPQRPAWNVAGVDYAVGVPSSTVLKDPTVAANLPAGTYIDAVNHVVHVDGANVTLNGFDFGLHGGWGVVLDAGTSGTTTIANSNFSMGAGQPIAIDSRSSNVGNLVVAYDTFNGNQANIPSTQPPPAGTGLGAAINYDGTGTFVAEYNYLYNLPADGIDFSNGTVTPTIKYNLFGGLGYTPGAHPDPVQFYGGNVNNAVIAFNTIYSPQGSNKSANEGLAIESQGGGKITNTLMENNVIIATGPTMTQSLNIGVFQDPGNTTNGVVVANNYLDPTASWGAFGSGPSAPQGSNLTFSDNVNLPTGKQIASPAGTGTSDVTGVVASPASGVQHPGATITLTLSMDQLQLVTGTPTLTLNDGGTASYAGGSGTNKLTFAYTVGSTDNSVSTLAITGVNLASGATIKDQFGNAANLGGALVSLSGLSVTADASAPGGAPAFIFASDTSTSTQAGQSNAAASAQPDLSDVLKTAGGSAGDMVPAPAVRSGASMVPNPDGGVQGAAFLAPANNGVPLGRIDGGGSGLFGT